MYDRVRGQVDDEVYGGLFRGCEDPADRCFNARFGGRPWGRSLTRWSGCAAGATRP